MTRPRRRARGLSHRTWLAAVLSALALAAARPALAEERPLWELGAGPFFLAQPDYRGAAQSRGYILPFPYVVYRGDRLRVDRDGIRGMLFETDRVAFDISVFGSPPVDSGDNSARQGMPDLDATLEIGPMLDVTLAQDTPSPLDFNWRLRLRLPVRFALASDFSSVESIGVVSWPHLNLDTRQRFWGGEWWFGLNVGPQYASRRYNEYFYSVQPQYATPTRPAYDAPGGYGGTIFLASLSRRFKNIWAGGYLRYDTLSGAAFDQSPLVRRSSYYSAGLAIAWVFAESSERVEAPY
jgi:outer membrane scaffolding protein for murein synthesis (MipA/OmpV family)